MTAQTLGNHQSTYDAVFRHPISRNLQWREVQSMLTALAEDVQVEPNGNFKFTRNGQTVVMYPPKHKDFSDVQEMMHIRHFLENFESTPTSSSTDSDDAVCRRGDRSTSVVKQRCQITQSG